MHRRGFVNNTNESDGRGFKESKSPTKKSFAGARFNARVLVLTALKVGLWNFNRIAFEEAIFHWPTVANVNKLTFFPNKKRGLRYASF